MDKLSYTSKKFNQLSTGELYEILNLRQEIFVVEQDCPYIDTDYKDQDAIHIMGRNNDGKLHAYARVIPVGISYEGYASIGRVITSAAYRGKGEGRHLMQASIDMAKDLDWNPLKLSAQVYAIPFYKRLGFEPVGEEYLEDNIPHIAMIRE